jgi:spore coat protein H
MNALFDKYHNLISPYVIGANGEQASYTHLTNSASFTSALASLKAHVSTRRALISTYVP